MLRLYDLASEQVAPLAPTPGATVGLYVCGPTVYGPPHLGHGRLVLVFDVLRRWMQARGLSVRHVENITDVDDKIIDRAMREHRRPEEIAEEAEAQWWAAMDRLGALRPHESPHATDWIAEMVELVAKLLERQAAYATSDGVYFDTRVVADYGLLKHQDVERLLAGARVAPNEEKRAPADFALWKAAKPGEPSWEAPFGAGRPGWHTECVAMSLGILGEGFELHGGGADLIFPHHENERAQAVALGRPFARRWLHSGLLTVEQEKMSKSLNNYVTLDDLLAAEDARALRLVVCRAHYRSPLEAGADVIAQASATLERIDALAQRLGELPSAAVPPAAVGEAAALGERVAEAMDDDLDTPSALGALFSGLRRANALLDAGDHVGGGALGRAVIEGLEILGLVPVAPGGADAEAEALLAARDAARAGGDYATADRLRDELAARGWRVEDGPAGSRLRRDVAPAR
ncbi:MAG: cysteine--tRNA ligase [Actinomycetota bacterium]|nr:cysteine--tRNA ligase [Actinomycetota bacterium]